MKIRFVKNYIVRGERDGVPATDQENRERLARGELPKGIAEIFVEGDVIEVEDGGHFVKRSLAVIAGESEKAISREELQKKRVAQMLKSGTVVDPNPETTRYLRVQRQLTESVVN